MKSFFEHVEQSATLVEAAKKNQIKNLFENQDFRIGLEFEFYNTRFLDENGRMNSEQLLILTKYIDLINETKKQNKSIVLKNKQSKVKMKRLVSAKQILDDFEKKERKELLTIFSKISIDESELLDLTYRYINSALENMGKYMLPSDYRSDIFEKYKKDDSVLVKYMHFIINNASDDSPDVQKEFKNFYKKESNLPDFIRNPKISTTKANSDGKKWLIVMDESVPASYGGVEFVSPVLTPREALIAVEKMFSYIRTNGNTKSYESMSSPDTKRDTQCGLHINISHKNPEKMRDLDVLKFILLSDESRVDKDVKNFGDRKDADYIGSILKRLKAHYNLKANQLGKEKFVNSLLKNQMKLGQNVVQSLLIYMSQKYSNINITHYRYKNKSVRRAASERLEIRYFGGENYHLKLNLFRSTLGSILYALDVASDVTKEQERYRKKLYKLIDSFEDMTKAQTDPPF